MSILGLLVALIIIGLLFWAVNAILRAFGVGDPIATLVRVVLVVLIVLWLVSTVFGVGPAIRIR
jgi:hypothetical protein